jgi:hypothetical protein
MFCGFPGDVNRSNAGMTVTPESANPSYPIPAFGVPVAIITGGSGVRPLTAADTTGSIYGWLVREYPNQAMPPNTYGAAQALGVGAVPNTQGPLSVMRRGFMTVNVNAGSMGSAVKGGQVFVWTAATTTGHVQGNVEAVNSPGNTIAAPALFRGPVDSNGNTEIEINI